MDPLSYFIYFVVSTVLAEALRPKPKFDKPARAGLSDFSLPTFDETRAVPVVFGTVKTTPAVLWYGDYAYEEITKKVRTGWFSSSRMTLAYLYMIGQQFAICHGAIDEIVGIWVDDKKAWSGSVVPPAANSGNAALLPFNYTYTAQEGAEYSERIAGTLEIAGGYYISPYMVNQLGDGNVPAYPNMTTIVWRGSNQNSPGTVGTSPTPPGIYFEVRRLPNLLESGFVTDWGYASEVAIRDAIAATGNINGNANPAFVIAECLTNKRWGAGLFRDYIDRQSIVDCAQTLFDEGNGASFVWETQSPVEDVIKGMLAQINGVLDVDHHTGLMRLRLIRQGQEPVLQISPSNIKDGGFKSFSRSSYDEATNSVRVPFVDREAGYIQRQAEAQDLGAIAQANSVISVTQNYIGVTDADLAATLALRDARAASGAIARCSVDVILAKGQLVRPGDVVELTWPPLGFDHLKMRVLASKYAQGFNSVVSLELAQDVFSAGAANYKATIPPVEAPTLTPATRSSWGRLFIAPQAITTDQTNRRLLFCCGAPADGSATGYRLAWWDGEEARTEANASYNDGGQFQFASKGNLNTAISEVEGYFTLSADEWDVATARKGTGRNILVLIGGSEYAQGTVAVSGAGTLAVTLNARGLFGTTAAQALQGAEVVLLYGYAIDSAPLGLNGAVTARASYALAQTVGAGGVLSIDAQEGGFDAGIDIGFAVS